MRYKVEVFIGDISLYSHVEAKTRSEARERGIKNAKNAGYMGHIKRVDITE